MSLSSTLFTSAFLLCCCLLLVQGQTLSPGLAGQADFEVPIPEDGGDYTYYPQEYGYSPPVAPGQPFVWSPSTKGDGGGGIAVWSSPFDVNGPSQPPSGYRYAFLQNAGPLNTSTMTASYTGLTVGASYVIMFYLGTRTQYIAPDTGIPYPDTITGTGSDTLSQLFVTVGGALVYRSQPNISDAGGWNLTVTSPFIATSVSGSVQFLINTSYPDDHSVTFDAITILPASAMVTGPLIPTPGQAIFPSQVSTFEFPDAFADQPNQFDFEYESTIYSSPLQPWAWTNGGVAPEGSPFDPPPPTTPPSGNQYAFLQTSPHGDPDTNHQNMSVTIAGLTLGSSYVISFYYGVRGQSYDDSYDYDGGAGNFTETQLYVLVDNVAVWVSPQNLTDVGGFTKMVTGPFKPIAANAGQAELVFMITSPTDQDHTILFDDVLVSPVAPVVASSTGAARAIGDPQFVGFLGQRYQIHGVSGAVYNILSQSTVSINALFVFLTSGECPQVDGVKSTNCWTHPGSYFASLAMQTSEGDRLHIVAGAASQGFLTVKWNGLVISDAFKGLQKSGANLSLVLLSSHMMAVSVGNYELVIENSDHFLNLLSVRVLDWHQLKAIDQPHGLLGQTWKSSTRQGRMTEGDVDDYVIASNDAFGTDFLYNQFTQQR